MTGEIAANALVAGMGTGAELPRSNGELVFSAPWESRAFGMAVALHEQGIYDWDAFRDRLIDEIGAHGPDDGRRYYERWLASLEQLLLGLGVVTDDEIEQRVEALAQQDDHDHDHDGHDHH